MLCIAALQVVVGLCLLGIYEGYKVCKNCSESEWNNESLGCACSCCSRVLGALMLTDASWPWPQACGQLLDMCLARPRQLTPLLADKVPSG